eukprot:TCALIF_00585-PA protein Name:"Similar to emc4 ER membrane protein complex subunit 4 (Salmo salar)" AED:0.12 eAED:0.12 QI:0/0/0/0.66/1/1/3/0/188
MTNSHSMSRMGGPGGGGGRWKWSLDFNTGRGGRGGGSGSASELSSPPGYSVSNAQQAAEVYRTADKGLKVKRSWDLALGPIKQVPMNLFIMYMSGNTISIFPIMMVIMMAIRPLKTLFTVNATFKNFDANDSPTSHLGQKFVFVLGNLANVALAMYKCHGMGLLPTHASDWLAFADPIERVEWAYVGM